MKISLVLADDHPLTREGLRSYLQKDEELELLGEAENGEEALEAIRKLRPDVALLDIRMPLLDGVAVVKRMKEEGLATLPIMLTSYDAQQYVISSLRAGARGYLLKTASPETLFKAIRIVRSGGLFLDLEVASAAGEEAFTPEALSEREREVLVLAAKGLPSREIAEALSISERTVQAHLASIYGKLGARNKTEAILLSLKYGWVFLEELLE